MKKTTHSVISLFSGCGGLDLGITGGFKALNKSVGTSLKTKNSFIQINNRWLELGKTRFEIKFINDINKYAIRSYKANIPLDEETIIDQRSIVEIEKDLKKQENSSLIEGNCDLLLAGFPCQDFSPSGSRNGFNSNKTHDNKIPINGKIPAYLSRGSLYQWMRKVIEITRPKVFIAENVGSIKFLKVVNDKIVSDLSLMADSGYEIFVKTLNAADYGIPQFRNRIFFVGYHKEQLKESVKNEIRNFSPFPISTHKTKAQINGSNYNEHITAREAFAYLKEPNVISAYGISDQNYYSKASKNKGKQGQAAIAENTPSMTVRANHHGNIEFRRMVEKNGKRQRRLSIRECALLQSFPPDFNFVIPNKKLPNRYIVSMSEAYKLIGNAVPPLLGYHFAIRLNEIWNDIFPRQ